MRRRAFIVVAALAAATVAAPSTAVAAPAKLDVAWLPAHPRNYSSAYRPSWMVRRIVVHSIEGSYWGAISWFRNPRARASSNYVVARTGAIAQMVSERRVAWHAGNGWVNRHSIGIEHEGYAGLIGTFTDTEYRASAQLTASILRRYVLPIDRRHVIAHAEVPHPTRPWRRGGYSGHTDPGPYWDWTRYMVYVRAYAARRTPPLPAFDVTVPNLAIGQTVRGIVRWEAVTTGLPATRVEFLVDGRLRQTQRQPPYVFGDAATGWDTTRELNGRRRLTVRAIAADGRVAVATVVVTIRNAAPPPVPPPPPDELRIVGFTLMEGQIVTEPVPWEAFVNGTPQRVEFLVDGVLRDTQRRAPYVFGGPNGVWDVTRETRGPHRLTVRAVGARSVVELTITVVVAAPGR